VNYAYITSDWNDDAVGAALGGSDTHQLEIGRLLVVAKLRGPKSMHGEQL
jgi:hypothetical protein